jgi:hypothetical protein
MLLDFDYIKIKVEECSLSKVISLSMKLGVKRLFHSGNRVGEVEQRHRWAESGRKRGERD